SIGAAATAAAANLGIMSVILPWPAGNWTAQGPGSSRRATESRWHSIYNWRCGDAGSHWQDRGCPRNLAAAKPARQRPVLDLGDRHNACSSYSWITLGSGSPALLAR